MTGSRRRRIKLIIILSVGSTEPSRPYQKLLYVKEKEFVKFICLIFPPKQKVIARKIIEIGWQSQNEMVTTLKDTTMTEGVRYNVFQYKSEFRELHSIISLALLGRRSQIFVDFIFERSYRR